MDSDEPFTVQGPDTQDPDPGEDRPPARKNGESRFAGITGLLTRGQIQNHTELAYEIVEVPEWETEGASKVIVQELSAEARDSWEAQTITSTGGKALEVNMANARAKLVRLSILDPADGMLLFSEDDIASLGRLSGAAMQRVFEISTKLSKLGKEDIEALVKGLEQTPDDDSNTDSPSGSDAPAASS